MTALIYSAAAAPLSWASFFFISPHFLGGGALLLAALNRRCWLRGLPSKFGLPIQGLIGTVFFTSAAFLAVNGWLETLDCRRGSSIEVQTITGPLKIDKRFHKPGLGYIEFSIDGHSLHTYTSGLNCDCGYIEPLGRVASLVENQVVRAQVSGSRVLNLEHIE